MPFSVACVSVVDELVGGVFAGGRAMDDVGGVEVFVPESAVAGTSAADGGVVLVGGVGRVAVGPGRGVPVVVDAGGGVLDLGDGVGVVEVGLCVNAGVVAVVDGGVVVDAVAVGAVVGVPVGGAGVVVVAAVDVSVVVGWVCGFAVVVVSGWVRASGDRVVGTCCTGGLFAWSASVGRGCGGRSGAGSVVVIEDSVSRGAGTVGTSGLFWPSVVVSAEAGAWTGPSDGAVSSVVGASAGTLFGFDGGASSVVGAALSGFVDGAVSAGFGAVGPLSSSVDGAGSSVAGAALSGAVGAESPGAGAPLFGSEEESSVSGALFCGAGASSVGESGSPVEIGRAHV